MGRGPAQILWVSVAVLSAAAIAYLVTPRQLMARAAASFDLASIVPAQFGEWTQSPNVRLVEPEPDSLSKKLYSQELGRGYRDREGHLVMLLIAYGPNQSTRLQVHRPEICYTAAGFRVSPPSRTTVSYREGVAPLPLLRLTAQRESRREPISYWTRVGNDVPVGQIQRNLIRLRLIMQGIIADGALIRISTIGLADDVAYEVQDRFIRDLLAAVAPEDLDFFVGRKLEATQAATQTVPRDLAGATKQ